jgi:uncharacterized phage protein gp47/JayE
MVRKIIAETPLNDVNQGSVLLTLLEACASNDFENNAAILSVLDLLNIDTLQGSDLDSRAADYGLSRGVATRASGYVSIFNTSIEKQSSSLYVIKPPPTSGQTIIYVNSTSGWATSGSLYIGRGTTSFEGPINYSFNPAIDVFPTYTQITLASALQNNHLISDTVVTAQGQPDRVIPSGTSINISANSISPKIEYTLLRDAILPAGEVEVTQIPVVALSAGSSGNAPINTITNFEAVPFTGATVTNPDAFTTGEDVETDQDLRDRLKNYVNTLSRGTANAIISAVIGVSDPQDNKQVASAVIAESPSIGAPATLYIDDGTGFEPSYAGQGVEVLLANANGTEKFLQLTNFPVTRPQVVNAASGPFDINAGSFLRVTVDTVQELITFSSSQFANISSAQVSEIVVAINAQSENFKAYTTNNSQNILLLPTAWDAETIQVGALQDSDLPSLYANTVLQFPTAEYSYISLFKNNNRLRQKQISAVLETAGQGIWGVSNPGNISIAVDGTPEQDRTFTLSLFPGVSSWGLITLQQWADAFNSQFAGITATATANQTLKIQSNREGSASSLAVIGGSLASKLFPTQDTFAVGQDSGFLINRQTGNIEMLQDIQPGDAVSAGISDARGFVQSVATTTGTYLLTTDGEGHPANMIIVADSTYCDKRSVVLSVGMTITVSIPSSPIARILSSSASTFAALLPGDYIYVSPTTAPAFNVNNTGLFKVVAKGDHLTAGTDTYIEVWNQNAVAQTAFTIIDTTIIQGFGTDAYPQIWYGASLPTPAAASLNDIVDSIGSTLINIRASIYQSNSIRITSNTETGGSIAIPVAIGNTGVVFSPTASAQFGNQSQTANLVSSKSAFTYFKPQTAVDTWINRQIVLDVKGALTANATPDPYPFSGSYGESIQSTSIFNSSVTEYGNIINLTRGDNKGQQRTVAAFLGGDTLGTQKTLARTSLNHIIGDEFQVVKPYQFSSGDNLVAVIDNDSVNKTININMARTGQINSGSWYPLPINVNVFIPTTTEFSANDYDNQPGINFSSAAVWSTSLNDTDFSDYAIWFRARNYYCSGGIAGTDGKMILRASEYGPNGSKIRFNMVYPISPSLTPTTTYVNTPSNTLFSYVFGSDVARPIAVSAADTITVTGPYPNTTTNFPAGAGSSGNYYDYTFSAGNFSSVVSGDILSILAGSGVSTSNSGQFGIKNKSGLTVRVLNPVASVTTPGSASRDTLTAVADVAGTAAVFSLTARADVSNNLNNTYFLIYAASSPSSPVVVWFNMNGAGVQPVVAGASRYIACATVSTNDIATTVADKVVNTLNNDSAFTASRVGAAITITNVQVGLTSNAAAGTSGFTSVSTTPGTDPVSVNGKYFLVYDSLGSVAIWYDLNNSGITPEPSVGQRRSIRITTVNTGDSAATIATKTVAALVALTSDVFTASVVVAGAQFRVIRSFNGNVAVGSAGNSGFTGYSFTPGTLPAAETITTPANLNIFPLIDNDVAAITSEINNSLVMTATPVTGASALNISVSTAEETIAVSYNHVPPQGYVEMYDSYNYTKIFSNINPNFTMKFPFVLQGAAPSIYSMDTCPNFDAGDGELFKLIPTTAQNLYHHFTQKALSTLPIVSNVGISNDRRNVQIASKQFGSVGAVQILGGTGNESKLYLERQSETSTDISGKFLLAKVQAFPSSCSVDDIVLIENDAGVNRFNRVLSTDTVNVSLQSVSRYQYAVNAKSVSSSGTTFAITDVGSSYGYPTGFVFRWTQGGTLMDFSRVQAGDLLYAFGTLSSSWAYSNRVRSNGEEVIGGLPIVAVNTSSGYVDVINPFGVTMTTQTVGTGTVQICSSQGIQWVAKHAGYNTIASFARASGTITVSTSSPHFLNNSETVYIRDSSNISDGSYGPITVTSPTQFTFSNAGLDFNETPLYATVIKNSLSASVTRYRLEKLGYNDLVRLSWQGGQQPYFSKCGVAVDDYIVIKGNTFSANNNGTFRVLAVDDSSVIFKNPSATEQLNTIIPMNNRQTAVSWTASGSTVTGTAGSFKYVTVGSWVKKENDPESYFLQVTALNAAPLSATEMTLGGNYLGSSSAATGLVYNQDTGYDQGIFLKDPYDVTFYEGDSLLIGDTLNVQNSINSGWFSAGNCGNFTAISYGTDNSYRPYVLVSNSSGVVESGITLSSNPNGFYVTESLENKFYTIRKVARAVINSGDSSLRDIYLTPSSRSYKFSVANNSSITHLGKASYSDTIVKGLDGYTYYTGLLQNVQRIVDGYAPDSNDYPGQRAAGSAIETLPPLIKQIYLSLSITTNFGVNLSDVSNNVKTTVINYIEKLAVGEAPVLSQIIANIQAVKGIATVVITSPSPTSSQPTIPVLSNEKALVQANNIVIS